MTNILTPLGFSAACVHDFSGVAGNDGDIYAPGTVTNEGSGGSAYDLTVSGSPIIIRNNTKTAIRIATSSYLRIGDAAAPAMSFNRRSFTYMVALRYAGAVPSTNNIHGSFLSLGTTLRANCYDTGGADPRVTLFDGTSTFTGADGREVGGGNVIYIASWTCDGTSTVLRAWRVDSASSVTYFGNTTLGAAATGSWADVQLRLQAVGAEYLYAIYSTGVIAGPDQVNTIAPALGAHVYEADIPARTWEEIEALASGILVPSNATGADGATLSTVPNTGTAGGNWTATDSPTIERDFGYAEDGSTIDAIALSGTKRLSASLTTDNQDSTLIVAFDAGVNFAQEGIICSRVTGGTLHNVYTEGDGGGRAYLRYFDGSTVNELTSLKPVHWQGNVLILRLSASAASVYLNGSRSDVSVTAAGSMTSIIVGSSNVGLPSTLNIRYAAVIPEAVRTNELDVIDTALRSAYCQPFYVGTTPQFHVISNSIGAGAGASAYANGFAPLTVQEASEDIPGLTLVNYSIPSTQTTDISGYFARVVEPFLPYTGDGEARALFFAWEATNHIALGAATAAVALSAIYSLVDALHAAAIAHGIAEPIVITGTLLPRGGNASITTFNTNLLAACTAQPSIGEYIYQHGTRAWLYVVDYSDISPGGDGVHPDDAGHAEMAARTTPLVVHAMPGAETQQVPPRIGGSMGVRVSIAGIGPGYGIGF